MSLPTIIVISGPSASGKSSLALSLEHHSPKYFKRMVNTTTRPPREGEEQKREYLFVSEQAFDKLLKADTFFDTITTIGGRFGSPRPTPGEHVLVYNLSLAGALQMREQYPSARIFYLTISRETQLQRLTERNLPLAEIDARIANYDADAKLIAAHSHTVTILSAEQPEDTEQNRKTIQSLIGL